MTGAEVDADLAQTRAAILAEIQARPGLVTPSMRPLALNTQHALHQVPAPLAAKLEARVEAGYQAEGNDYPTSRTWSRVVVPAIALGAVDLPVVAITGILAAFNVHLAWWLFLASLLVLVGATATAIVSSIAPLRDPLRLTTPDRRQLDQARSWQSRQPWMGPRSATPEYRLMKLACDTTLRLVNTRAWASPFLDEHRLRLNLAQELDGIDYQACQLAVLREQRGSDTSETTQAQANQAWSALLDRVARLRHYADGVAALDTRVAELDASARAAQLDDALGRLAVGSALDQFAAEQVRSLTADLTRLAADPPSNAIGTDRPATSFAPLPASER